MIAPRVQKGLINGSADEVPLYQVLQSLLLRSEHIVQTVAVVFKPKVIVTLSVEGWVGARSACRIDHRVGVRAVHYGLRVWVDWPSAWPQCSSEPVVPVLETPMRLATIDVIVIVVGPLLGFFAEPTVRLFSQILRGSVRKEHILIVVENSFEMKVG